MLGADLLPALSARADFDAVGLDLPDIDIADLESVAETLDETNPSVVVNCAAYTDVDGCESQTALAMAVNAEGPGNLASACKERGARLIHVSTDFVFDGRKGSPYTEDDEPNPISIYALSKLAGERRVAEADGDWAVARTAWLYGRNGKNFVDSMLHLARQREDLAVVTDQVGSPTWTRDLAVALIALIDANVSGVYHTANAGACSRYEMVEAIVEFAGLGVRLKPADSSAFPRPAAVPSHSPLDVSKLARDAGCRMRPWREALREYLASRTQ